MVRKYYDMNAILGGGGGTGLGQYSATNNGGLSGNSEYTPYELGEATVKPKNTGGGFDWLGLANTVFSNAGDIIGGLNGNATPKEVNNYYNTTPNDSGNNKGGQTMLFIALGVAALVIAILIFKK